MFAYSLRKISLLGGLLSICLVGIAPLPGDAITVILRQDALQAGYSVSNKSGTFRIGVQPDAITSVKKTRLKISKLTAKQAEKYPTKSGSTQLISDIYVYKLGKGKAKKVQLNKRKPLGVMMSYPDIYKKRKKVIKYWDKSASRWRKLRTKDNKSALQVNSSLRHKYAVLGVFVKPEPKPKKSMPVGNVVKGLASWYYEDEGEAACNSFPMGSRIRVTNLANGKYVDVKIVSRGPFVPGRVVDLSDEDFSKISTLGAGIANVSVQLIE